MALAEKQGALTVNEINTHMKKVPRWSLHDKSIVREFDFKDFRQAMNFVNRVAQIAEAQDHHPDITISYNKVKLELSTHEAGGLTVKDFGLAEKLDQTV